MQQLLVELHRLGVKLRLEKDELRVNAPHGALTDELRQALQRHKDDILKLLRAERAADNSPAAASLVPDAPARAEPFPLSDLQHAYWLGRGGSVEMGGVSTHLYVELDCAALDIERLNNALHRMIERHDMLRAVVGDDGMQRILPVVPQYRIAVCDVAESDAKVADDAVLATRKIMSHQVRPADQWPLFEVRATLMPGMPGPRVRLHVSLDMLIMDAWSIFVFFQEWHQSYQTPDGKLPEIDISFRDYVLAERRILESAAYANARRYWADRLESLPAAPELPIRATGVRTNEAPRFSRRRVRIDKARWSKLQARAREAGLTPSGLLLAVYAEVLTRWSATPHYTLNLTLFNRLPLHPHVSRLIGDFTSLTLLEVDHRDRNCTFKSKAAALQRRLMDDLQHREYSGVKVVREWGQRQHAGLHAAMPVVFTSALVLGSGEAGQDAGLVERFGPMAFGISQTPQVWLDNQVMEVAGELVFNWDAVDAMFEPGVLDAMFDAHHALLVRLADEDDAWEKGDPIRLPSAMLEQRSAPDAPPLNTERLLHAGLFEHAKSTPDAPAVISGARTLTYRMLLNESTAVAQWLQAQGLQQGQLVGVVMHKGWEQVVAVLGVLLAGGAYMPVDANLPIQRQNELLQQGEARCVLTQPDYSPCRLDRTFTERHVVYEVVPPDVNASPVAPFLSPNVQPADLAYVIFTSGTTGQPKGVMISHRSACNTIAHINAMLGLQSTDRILGLSSLSFDLSVYDVFGALDAGAALVLPDAARHLDAVHWRELIDRHRVSICNAAPQLVKALADVRADEVSSAPVRAVLISGDWIPVELPGQLMQHYPGARVISLGGATEASIWSIYYPIDRVDPAWASIPYGKELPNQTMWVLNPRFDTCPDYVKGRIYIGGEGLAEGYWRDPERTAQRFIVHPDSGERLYDTGDLGRYSADGNIEFLGRDDDQVKIRGHRVEPGEVASVLRQHPEVEEAVVLPTGSRQHRQLAAYVKLNPERLQELAYRRTVSAPAPLAQSLKPVLSATGARGLDAELQATWSRLDDYYLVAVATAFCRFGISGLPGEVITMQDLFTRGVAHRYQRWLQRAFDALCQAGMLRETNPDVFEVATIWKTAELPEFSLEVQQRLRDVVHFSDEEASWLTQAAERLPDILTERMHSGEIYTADVTPRLYQKLFPDNHAQLARVVETLARQQGRPLSVMEIGAGFGSATQHVLPPLAAAGCRYVFTDISEFFLHQAKTLFGEQFGNLEFARYDVDIRPEFQGIEPHSFDMVLASSMLHDVRAIQPALDHITRLLKPGGQLVLLEETRFFRSFDLHMGLQQGFDLFTDTELRSSHSLLSRDQWEQVLIDAGFTDVLAVEAPGTLIEYLGFHVIVATAPLQATTLDTQAVRSYLGSRLPDYMVPQHIVQMTQMPITANGKVDYKALPTVPEKADSEMGNLIAPRNEVELMIQDIWKTFLPNREVGVTDNFFDLGGDSLIALQVVNEINKKTPYSIDIHELLHHQTIESLALLIQIKRSPQAQHEATSSSVESIVI